MEVVGVSPGDPFDRRTWSGASHHLFTALGMHAELLGVVNAEIPRWADLFAKAAAIWPERHRWRERNEFSPVRRLISSRRAGRAATALARPGAAVLQVGAWYDAAARATPPAALRCSYHDSNLALLIRQGQFVQQPDAGHIRRTLRAERRVFDGLDVIFTMSEWLRTSIIKDFEQDPDKVVVVGSGVNLKQLPPPLRNRRAPSQTLLFVGFDFAGKGGQEILQAFAQVRRRLPNARLQIVGPPPQSSVAGVEWIGAIDRSGSGDLRFQKILANATGFVLASHYDAFPNVFLEAMAYSLPCIGTPVGGIPEIIQDGATGHLVPVGDIVQLATAMEKVLADPDNAALMGEAGYRRVTERFTWDLVGRKMAHEIGRRLTQLPVSGEEALQSHASSAAADHPSP